MTQVQASTNITNTNTSTTH